MQYGIESSMFDIKIGSTTLKNFSKILSYQTTLTLTRNLGPGALFTRARDVQAGLPGESEWRGSRLAQQRERCALHGGT